MDLIVSEPCIDGYDDLSHCCGDSDNGWLSVFDQASVEGCELAFSLCCAHCGHEKGLLDLGPSAALSSSASR
ncbi:hypothetical protein, partial [Agrobacterium larrymoorei]|uniref:hypothetical protein n=1 Tax=Agrobacterium larrymoorei TaxID=160699 RepID=UPI001AEBF372